VSRAGFVALAGRPNVGKSTFVNAVVGRKVAIVSDRPQTTRRAIRAVHTHGENQVVLVDLPGVQRPRDALTARMARRVGEELGGADAVLLIVNAEQGVGPGDRHIAHRLAATGRPGAIAVNKIDRLTRAATVAALAQAGELGLAADIFPISARTGDGVPALLDHLERLLPEGPPLYAEDQLTDQPLRLLIAELIREAAIRRVVQELPHVVEVVVEDVERRPDAIGVRALLWVETESQKGILIGAGGRTVKAVGSAARRELEHELKVKVHLDLAVRVRRGWRADESLLDRLGIG